ncbi:nSTAND1 domain-containing NTPase [Streptomyces sp. DH10]|uniref:nSTAND1 domain-containing NTPase n=1 Tax=Streptomyces sp. DH10 TaxID=3040121 RepID=UPI0024430714|nr:helix-turn-helix domain-containing protein [Streptomyces sp. DH10]MDG9710748.1 helix-turn-helix domain-containing protein [Streptomyces sp. DH10]
MGRREKPVDPSAGPVQRLAHDLRLLREKAGKPPYREMAERAGYSTTALSQAAAGDQLPTLTVVRAYVEALGGDPDEWEARWREADAELRAPAADERAPYRGLARFEPADSDLFFGREALARELLHLARAHRFAAVFGPSGSGKSSLLRAGLVPLLREGTGADRPAVVRVLTPGERPAHAHGQALIPQDGELDTWVIIDQFEEVFTLCHDREERGRFLDLLLGAREPESRLRVVVAVRGDFYGHCAEHRELAEAVRHANLLVGPMSGDELREVVTGPATAAGLNVERVLTARIIEEVGDRPGALPMLSHALLETWRRRRGRTLTLAAYEEAGGVRGAIAATAEQVYGDLDEGQARTARRILLRLIAPGDRAADTRRPASRSELGPGALDVLERLAAARLVTLDGDTVELAHEALITGWPRLAGWIEESRDRLRVQRVLGEAARAWEELERDPGALFRGARLERAEELFGGQREKDDTDDLTRSERAFLTASAAARDAERDAVTRTARRTRALTVGLSVFLVLALTAGLVAWQRDRVGEEEAAKAAARRLATVAESLRATDPRTASLLGAAAWRIAPLTETRSGLLGALAQPERDAFTDPQTGQNVRRFLTDQGRTLLRADGGRVTAWNVAEHRRTAAYHLPSDAEATGVGPDGRSLVLTGSDSDTLWNLPEGRSVADLGNAALGATAPDTGAYLTQPFDGSGQAQVRRTENGEVLFTTGVSRSITTAALAGGGRLVALCPAESPPQVWDTVRGRQVPGAWQKADETVCGTGSGADGGDRLLRLSTDGRRLASVHGTAATVWDVGSGRVVADFASGGTTGFAQADLSPDGEFLATTDDQEIAVWQLASGGGQVFHRPLAGAEVTGLTWTPDHGRRVLRYLDRATVHTFDLTDRLAAHWQSTSADATLLGPDGTTLATATRSGHGYRFELRSTSTGAVLARSTLGPLPSDTGDETPQLSFSPDGRTLAVADTTSSGGSLRLRVTVWDVRTHTVRTSFTTSGAADRPVSALALGSDGHTLLAVRSAGDGEAAEVWDTRTHRVSRTLRGLFGQGVAVRPDGRLLVGSADQYADVPSGKVTGWALADGREVTALAFSPDGTRLAVGDTTGHVTLWDGDLRHTTGVLTGTADTAPSSRTEAVGALAFSSDGGTLAVGGAGGTLRLWDAAGQRLLGGDLPTSGDEVRSLAFGGNDGTLYATGPNVLLQRRPIAPDAAVRAICERAGGGLTRAQWRRYVPDAPYRQVCPGAR